MQDLHINSIVVHIQPRKYIDHEVEIDHTDHTDHADHTDHTDHLSEA